VSDDLSLFDSKFGSPASLDVELDPHLWHSTSGDAELDEVAAWFRQAGDLREKLGSALRQSIDEVLDGQRTGRFDIDQVEKTEKTYLGTKVEIVIRSAFELPRGRRMDYTVAGHDVDSKFSIHGSWSIPTEAVGHLCLLTSANDRKGTFDAGLIRITPDILNAGRNKDKKTTIAAAAKGRIVWLARQAPLPGNLLLSLPPALIENIMGPRSGQERVNRLLRGVQGRVIERNTAVTVARQADGLRRCREARQRLAGDGIVVLGHQKQCPAVARSLGLPVPVKGTFLSVRLARVEAEEVDRPTVVLPEGSYAVARAEEPSTCAPTIQY
jgi:hypothetical protein